MRAKADGRSEDGAVDQNHRLGFEIGSLAQVEDVPVGAQAADDGRARGGGEGLAGGADGHFAVVAHADAGALAPDGGPPGTGGGGAENGSLFGQGLVPSGLRRDAQLAVDFVGVDVRQELVEEAVGSFQFADLVGGQQGRETFLPLVRDNVRFCLWPEGWGRSARPRRRSEGPHRVG